MYQRYYDGYPMEDYSPDEGETIIPDNTYNSDNDVQSAKADILPSSNEQDEKNAPNQIETSSFFGKGFLSSIQTDDIILIALLIILAIEAPDDMIMPLIIGYILLGDILPI